MFSFTTFFSTAKEKDFVPIEIDLEMTTASAFPTTCGTDDKASAAMAADYAHTLPGWIETRSGLDPAGLITDITHRVIGKVVILENKEDVIRVYQLGWQWLAGMKSCVEGGYHAAPDLKFDEDMRRKNSVAWMRMIVAAVVRSQAASK